jgi:hypothetical protein
MGESLSLRLTRMLGQTRNHFPNCPQNPSPNCLLSMTYAKENGLVS